MDWHSVELCCWEVCLAWSRVESFMALLPPTGALQDSMLDLHNQRVMHVLDRFELKGHLPLLAWMSAVFCLPSIQLSSSGSCDFCLSFFILGHSGVGWWVTHGPGLDSFVFLSLTVVYLRMSAWLGSAQRNPTRDFFRKISVAQLLGYTVEMPQLCSLSSIKKCLLRTKPK